MLLETRRSRRNEHALRQQGAVEPAGDVYPLMQVAYPACFLGMAAEAVARGPAPPLWVLSGALVFVWAKALKYWAMAALGPRWSFRVLVLPGAPLIRSGPYRWVRHPNYIGVAGELAGAALMAHAPVAGLIALAGFGGLMRARIRVEERALNACER